MPLTMPRFLGALLLAGAAAHLGARERLDLERENPVPATEPIPIMDFFRPRLLQAPALNPSGTHLAALVSLGKDRHDLLVYDIEKKTLETLHGVGDHDIYSFTWLTDRRLIYMLASQKLYGLGMMAVDTGRLTDTHPLLQYCGAQLVGIPERNRLRPLVWMRSDSFDNGRDGGVGEINTDIRAGSITNLRAAGVTWSDAMDTRDNNEKHVAKSYPVAPGGMGTGYLADRDGELAFAATMDDGVGTFHRFTEGRWEKCPLDLDQVEVWAAGEKPGELVVLAPREAGKPRALRFMDATNGTLGETLVQDKAYDFRGGLFRDRQSRQIVGVRFDRSGPQTIWFSEDYRTVQKAVDALFPGLVVQLVDMDNSGRFLVVAFSDRQPAIYHRVDLQARTVGLLKNSAPWIDPARMQPTNILSFKTRDGGKLDAYVTLPAGTSKKTPAPLVVLPHGGPWVRDTWGFNAEAQFLASRGFAVMQPNYRGSPGYDWQFPEEDRYEFRKMHDDVTDATKTLLATGLIDPKRVAIMGSSFGAYLALSGVVHEADLYRCAVTIAGVFDWAEVMKEAKFYQYDSAQYGYMKRKLGDPKKQKEKFDAISPARHVDQVRVPVFVSHGKDDPIADVGESKRLISELEKYNVPHEVLLIGGEGHGMGHLKNQVELYSRVETFLRKNLAPEPATAVAAPSTP